MSSCGSFQDCEIDLDILTVRLRQREFLTDEELSSILTEQIAVLSGSSIRQRELNAIFAAVRFSTRALRLRTSFRDRRNSSGKMLLVGSASTRRGTANCFASIESLLSF